MGDDFGGLFGQAEAGSGPDGEIRGRFRYPGPPATSPVPCRDRILIGTADGRLVGSPTRPDHRLWEVSCGSTPPSAPTCDHDAVLVGCGDSVFRIGIRKGKVKWRFRTGGTITARPVVFGRRIFSGSFDNDIYILKRKSGHLIEYRASSHRVMTDPLLLGNLLLVLPHTAGAVLVHLLPDLTPVGSIPFPLPEEGGCSAPKAAGPRMAVIGCGGENTRLYGLPVSALP